MRFVETRHIANYSSGVHTDDGLRLVNSALSNTEPAGPSELPAIDAPDR